MGMPVDGSPRTHLLNIHSSGVRFESDTGKASTDRGATFEFDQGNGAATGVDYDPNTRELHLRSQVSLDWRGKTAGAIPMRIEGGRGVLPGTRVEGGSASVVQAHPRRTSDGRRHGGGVAR